MPEYLDNQTLSMLFDAVLIVSLVGLWILWWRQVNQRKKIEILLIDASTQLQEATLMLNQALVKIQELQGEGGQEEVDLSINSQTMAQMEKEHFKHEIKNKVRGETQQEAEEQSQSTANISQVAQMLRLQREGATPENISKKLNLPLAQIKLMLMLQSSPKA